jgi:hypothetical protein
MGKRKQDGAGFVTHRFKSKLNAPPIGQPWIWMSHELLESGAYRCLSIHGIRALNRIQIEHMAHGGLENGRLKVTWNDFVKYGIGRRYVAFAITEITAMGIVAIERRGRKFHGEDRGDPTQYRLTYLPVSEPANMYPATNEWKRFGTSTVAAKNALKKIPNKKPANHFRAKPKRKIALSLVPKRGMECTGYPVTRGALPNILCPISCRMAALHTGQP